jgi:hypothetical protein
MTAAVLVYVVYLVQVVASEPKRKALMSKYKKNTNSYDLYDKIYSSRFLVVAIIVALSFVLNLAYDILRLSVGHGYFYISTTLFLVEFVSSLVALYVIYTLFKKK